MGGWGGEGRILLSSQHDGGGKNCGFVTVLWSLQRANGVQSGRVSPSPQPPAAPAIDGVPEQNTKEGVIASPFLLIWGGLLGYRFAIVPSLAASEVHAIIHHVVCGSVAA